MHNITCIFNNNYKITSNNILNFSIEKDNNNALKANITINKILYNKIFGNIISCKIIANNKKYFEGKVQSIQIKNNYINIIAIYNENNFINNNTFSNDLIERFKLNNPSLFQRRNNFNSRKIINNIENSIIKNSFIINIDKLLPISELDLTISASWNKLCNGYCDLTNKIRNKLKNGLISTLTPKKLIKSWPKLFDKLITNNKGILKTKYFVSHSKLEEYNSNTLKINDNKIIETFFDCKLSIGWEYYQFTTEILHCKIINNTILKNIQEYKHNKNNDLLFQTKDLHKESNSNQPSINNKILIQTKDINNKSNNTQEYIKNENSNLLSQYKSIDKQTSNIDSQLKNINNQELNINLHNVQEYIEDECDDSFFQSKIGNSIFNVILCEVKQFIINSMQNITITFQIPFSEDFVINQKIKISNYICIINKIEISVIKNKYITTITCIGSEYNNAFDNAIFLDTIIKINKNDSNNINSKIIDEENNNINNKITNKENNNNQMIMKNNNITSLDTTPNKKDSNIGKKDIIDKKEIRANNETKNILENIEIINTSEEQISKINNIKDQKKINDILNENATKVIITLNPIKTEHNKIENINIGEINLK